MTTTAATRTWLQSHEGITQLDHQPKLALNQIDLVASVTNQVRFEPIDAPTVERYVGALEDGAVFPPIIIRRITAKSKTQPDQLVIIGGNHRARAHLDAKRPTIDAFIIVCDDLTALEIAYGDNATHGLPPTNAERVAHALTLVDRGRTMSDAARTVGTSISNVAREQATRGVAKRCAELGLTAEFAQIQILVRPRLATITNDRLLAKVMRAIITEKITGQAASKLIGDLNAQPGYQAAGELLDAFIIQHRATAGLTRGTGRPSTNPWYMLRTALGTVKGVNAVDVADAAREAGELGALHEMLLAAGRHLMAIDQLADTHRKGAAA